jgi:hypothetical protein
MRVSARLNGPRVIAGGQYHRRNPVHDALVVGRRAVWVGDGQRVRVQDVVNHIAATESIGVEDRAGPR